MPLDSNSLYKPNYTYYDSEGQKIIFTPPTERPETNFPDFASSNISQASPYQNLPSLYAFDKAFDFIVKNDSKDYFDASRVTAKEYFGIPDDIIIPNVIQISDKFLKQVELSAFQYQ